MKVWRVTIATTGQDIIVKVPNDPDRDGYGHGEGPQNEANARGFVRHLFENGVWVKNVYYPPSYFLSATIEEVEK